VVGGTPVGRGKKGVSGSRHKGGEERSETKQKHTKNQRGVGSCVGVSGLQRKGGGGMKIGITTGTPGDHPPRKNSGKGHGRKGPLTALNQPGRIEGNRTRPN